MWYHLQLWLIWRQSSTSGMSEYCKYNTSLFWSIHAKKVMIQWLPTYSYIGLQTIPSSLHWSSVNDIYIQWRQFDATLVKLADHDVVSNHSEHQNLAQPRAEFDEVLNKEIKILGWSFFAELFKIRFLFEAFTVHLLPFSLPLYLMLCLAGGVNV